MELIKIKKSNLICDNKNCDYIDKTVYTISNDVNKKTENLGSLVKVKNFIANNIIC